MNAPRFVRIAVVAAFAMMALAGGAGCSRDAGEAATGEPPTPREREGDDGARTLSVSGSDIAMSGITRFVPEEWPAEIPVHPGAEVRSAQTISAGEGRVVVYRLELEVQDAPDAVGGWYAGELVVLGWTIDQQTEGGSEGYRRFVYAASRADGAMTVVATEASGGTSVHIEAGMRDEAAD